MKTAAEGAVVAFEGSPFAVQGPSDSRSVDRSSHFAASAVAVIAAELGQRHSMASKSSACRKEWMEGFDYPQIYRLVLNQ